MLALIKRELLEHSNIRRVPFILIGLALLIRLAILLGTPSPDINLPGQLQLEDAIDGAVTEAISRALSSMNFIVTIVLFITTVFYSLSCLYNERQDQSVLFWRSLPISDTTTIASKLIVALLVVPILIIICQLIVTFIFLDINSFKYLANYLPATVMHLGKMITWTILPVVAWCLFCSSIAERNPFLLAFVAPLTLLLVDNLFFGGDTSKFLIADRFTAINNYSTLSIIVGLVFSAICITFAITKRSQRI